MNFYNEIDPYAAQWIRNLESKGHVAHGKVETRSIEALGAVNLSEFTQCHFFAGIGVWSHALRLAGWPDSRPVWTGSCPCQPFSIAGAEGGLEDARHLWPAWFQLIQKHRPAAIFGEQVSGRAGLEWLDIVCADLESEGYAFGAADLPAASAGAPHIRQRLFFTGQLTTATARTTGNVWLGDTGIDRTREHARELRRDEGQHEERPAHCDHAPVDPSNARGVAIADGRGLEGRLRGDGGDPDPRRRRAVDLSRNAGATRGFWAGADWIYCRDGRWRPVEPGTFPLAHGVADRVGQLRAFGNAICGPVAAVFIKAVMEVIG